MFKLNLKSIKELRMTIWKKKLIKAAYSSPSLFHLVLSFKILALMICKDTIYISARLLRLKLLQNRRYSSTYFKTDSPNIYEYKNGFPIISICGSPSLTISPIHEYPDMIKVNDVITLLVMTSWDDVYRWRLKMVVK